MRLAEALEEMHRSLDAALSWMRSRREWIAKRATHRHGGNADAAPLDGSVNPAGLIPWVFSETRSEPARRAGGRCRVRSAA